MKSDNPSSWEVRGRLFADYLFGVHGFGAAIVIVGLLYYAAMTGMMFATALSWMMRNRKPFGAVEGLFNGVTNVLAPHASLLLILATVLTVIPSLILRYQLQQRGRSRLQAMITTAITSVGWTMVWFWILAFALKL